MAIVSLILAVVVLVLIGVGIAIGLVACAVTAALVGLGVVSSSVVVGMRSGRAADGVRVFLLQCGIIAGVPAGVFGAWLTGSLMMTEFQGAVDWPVLVCGGLAGALAGILVALALNAMWRRLHAWAVVRLPEVTGGGV
ncbi:MAG: hypothetical protein JWO82_4098 [Akkermansiaceae bacterium]|nr:hypothetical protein [Akkermansiaceae bacterium]